MQNAVQSAKFVFLVFMGDPFKKLMNNMEFCVINLYLIIYSFNIWTMISPKNATDRRYSRMKKTLVTIICATVATTMFLPLNSAAKTKKNDVDKKEVKELLEEIGGDHWIERMKVNEVCSMEFENEAGEDDYYHIYYATLKKGGYRVIVYNNVPEYLGFYPVEWEVTGYEEGVILLDAGGGSTFKLLIPAKGPSAKIRIDGNPITFVKNPKLEEEKKAVVADTGIPAVPKETSASGEVIDYRDWKITMKGKVITVNAKFVKIENGKISIKNSKNGKVASIPGSALSEEDKEYVKRITAK